MPEKSQHYGLTALLPQPLDPSEGLVVQYEATYTSGYNCGGSYVKLLTHADGFKAEDLVDTTPYTIMFGPDKCGDPNGKVWSVELHNWCAWESEIAPRCLFHICALPWDSFSQPRVQRHAHRPT